MTLPPRLCKVLGGWEHCFKDHRTFRRAKEHALLVCLCRRAISHSICVLGRQFQDWAPGCRWFSECRWKPHSSFDVISQQTPEVMNPTQLLVAALDGTPRHKTGKRIRAAKMLRNPLSPPYRIHLHELCDFFEPQ